MRLVALALLISAAPPGPPPAATSTAGVDLRDNGTRKGYANVINLRGFLGVSVDGGVATVTIGDGGYAFVAPAGCAFGFVLTSDGGNFQCIASIGPGAPPLSVQSNCGDGGFCGAALVYVDGGMLGFTPVTTYPAAPPAESLTNFAWQEGTGLPARPTIIESTIGLPIPPGVLGEIRLLDSTASWSVHTCRALGYGNSGAPDCVNTPGSGAITLMGGTGGNAWSSTGWMNLKRRQNIRGTAGAANTNGGYRWNALYFWRTGGFVWFFRYGMSVINSAQRVFMGVTGSAAAPTATVDPSTLGDVAYLGADSADTNLSCCSHGTNDAGAALCTSLGSNYPKALVDAGYDVLIGTRADAGMYCAVYSWPARVWSVVNFTTDLPTSTAQLAWVTNMNTGPSGTPTNTMEWMEMVNIWNMGP